MHDLRARLEDRFRGCQKHELKFITLTVRGTIDPLRDQVKNLWKSFRRLRQTTLWQRRVKHGVGILEITFNEETQMWHPHIHVLAIAGFIPQSSLSKSWEKASNGSKICDIRAVKSTTSALSYVLKYATKGGESLESNPECPRTSELINGLKRLKTVQWFGTYIEPENIDDDEDSRKAGVWLDVCYLSEALWLKRRGDQAARLIILALDDPCTKHPLYTLRLKPP